MEQRVLFAGEAGQLEGVLTLPDGRGPFPAVVVCHPHPQYGGSHENNVVAAVCRGAFRRGIASLRFNFRGVGASAGTFDGGNGEQHDVRAALSFLAAQEGIDPLRLGLAGYSFGAGVSARAVETLDAVQALALVSLPVRVTDGPLATAAMPKLFMVGDDDHVVTVAALRDLAARLTPAPHLIVVQQADHFWGGFEPQIADATGDFFALHLAPADR